MKAWLEKAFRFIINKWLFIVAASAILVWCLSYFTTGNRIEWGDFGMFAQAYEAIRISITEYGQFPWMNSWMAGGTPLYANPQIGVFSLQTITVILFGSALGLKIALVIYTFVGGGSMYLLLRKYFNVPSHLSILLSLIWIFNSFFVAHLPSHYTFLWYMLTPLFIYLSLRLDHTLKSGLLLGLTFGIMALSQIHNPFFHISLVCSAIIVIKLIRDYRYLKSYLLPLATAVGVFFLVAGHRLVYTIQNALEFPRVLIDSAPPVNHSVLGLLLPFSSDRPFSFINYPIVPFGWKETTAYIGAGSLIAFSVCFLYLLFQSIRAGRIIYNKIYIIILLTLITLAIALGSFSHWAPYTILKTLPIFSSMRVSSRWFIFTIFGILLTIGLIYRHMLAKSFARFLVTSLVTIGVVELFITNVGYQSNIFSHDVILASKSASSYVFEQSKQFGSTNQFPDGRRILQNDGNLPHFYREYEATSHNIGVIQANDALIDLNTRSTPRCGIEDGCGLVLTNNASVAFWSPNKIVLRRTADGPIKLNMNNSSYFKINGQQNSTIKVAEAYSDFVITNKEALITIECTPSLLPKIIN